MRKLRIMLCLILFGVLALAGCNKNTSAVTPTTAPTSTVAPTTGPTVTPTETPKYAGIPTLEQVAKDSLEQGAEYTGSALYGRGVDQLKELWG